MSFSSRLLLSVPGSHRFSPSGLADCHRRSGLESSAFSPCLKDYEYIWKFSVNYIIAVPAKQGRYAFNAAIAAALSALPKTALPATSHVAPAAAT